MNNKKTFCEDTNPSLLNFHNSLFYLRPIVHEDLETLFAWRNNPKVNKYLTSPPPKNMQDQRQWYSKYIQDPGSLHFMALKRDSEEIKVGYCQLLKIDKHKRSTEYGFVIGVEEYFNSALGDDLAAVIFEPVVGYSGPRRLHKDFLLTIRKFCDKNNVVMIADEIFTGFHRCKGWFVSCQDGIKPDVIVFGKGLGNGFPISGVASNVSLSKYLKNTIPGSTFAGNSLECAAACGVIDFMNQHNFPEKTSLLEKLFYEYFSQPGFESYGIKLDGIGGLLSISFEDRSFNRMQDIYLNVLKEGVITSHTQTYLRISPPLTIDLNEFERGLEIIGKSLSNYCSSGREKK